MLLCGAGRLVLGLLAVIYPSVGYRLPSPGPRTIVDGFKSRVTRALPTCRCVEQQDNAAPAQTQGGFQRRHFLLSGASFMLGVAFKNEAVKAADDDVLIKMPHRSSEELNFELFKRGMEFEEEGDLRGADAQWTEVIGTLSQSTYGTADGNRYLLARAYANRAGVRLNMGGPRLAVLDYSSSISLAPDRGEFWLYRGVAYEDLADRKMLRAETDRDREDSRVFRESALSDFDHAAVLDPHDARVYISRGDALSLLGSHQEALANYRKAAATNPTPELHSRIALEEIECGNLNRGALMIKGLLRRFPDHPELLLAASAVAWEYGELAEACDMYNEAIQIDPQLLDDDFLVFVLRWPAVPLSMLRTVRRSGTENRLAGVRTLVGSPV